MFKDQKTLRELFEIESDCTRKTIQSFSEEFLNKRPCDGFRSGCHLALHICITRESVMASALQDKERLTEMRQRISSEEELAPLSLERILEIWDESQRVFASGLQALDWSKLDSPFQTFFGSQSTARNYLTLALLEESYHRGQMVVLLRLFGLSPAELAYRSIATLGLSEPR